MSGRLRVLTYTQLVALAGAGVLVASLLGSGRWWPAEHPAVFAVLAIGVVLGELLPLKIPGRAEGEELTVSSAFAFALLLLGGVGAALPVPALASALQDVHARKPWWRATFNVGHYCLALGAAASVMHAISGIPHLDGNRAFGAGELPVVVLGAAVFFVVNFGVVGSAIAIARQVPLRSCFTAGWGFSALTQGVLLCAAPLIVAAEHYSLLMVPLFAVPLVALDRAARQAVRSEHAAMHDPLTELANRARFRTVAEQTLEAHPREPVAVLLMDLDRFKDVNDTLGHHYGDLLLQEVARRLAAAAPEAEVIARLGGDEFALLLGPSAARRLEDVVSHVVAAVRCNIEIGDFVVDADASIGIALAPEDGTYADTLLQRADVAMYRAKETHASWVRYDEAHDHHSPLRLALMSDLRHAINSRQIVVHYQPVLGLADGRLEGVEALVRWDHPDFGLLYPDAFLDLAERTSLIKPLTRHVLQTALWQLFDWRSLGFDLRLSVNVSVRSLLDPEFPDEVAKALADAGVSPRLLKLEITESTIMADPRVARRVLERLNAMGVGLSIDDFGTGYSSLAYLKDLPVDEVKIDRAFVTGIGDDPADAVIVESTTALGHHLGLEVVAEGVEDEATCDWLRRLGCDRAQGWFIGVPIPAVELTSLMLRDSAPWRSIANGSARSPSRSSTRSTSARTALVSSSAALAGS